jgi:lipid A 3-O-deacylase
VRKLLQISAGVALLMAASTMWAVDGISFEYGKSDSSNVAVDLYRAALQWDWGKDWLDTGSWHLGGYWDLSAAYWDNESVPRNNNGLADVGFTPVFRFGQNNVSGVSPYVELAVGIHFLSTTSINSQREFGSSFQFGDRIGTGLRFGNKGEYDLSYSYQHESNGSFKEPNQGINFQQLRLMYHF